MIKSWSIVVVLVLSLLAVSQVDADKKGQKYSREANDPQNFRHVAEEKYDPDFKKIQRPFRIAKLNLVWSKAQNVGWTLVEYGTLFFNSRHFSG